MPSVIGIAPAFLSIPGFVRLFLQSFEAPQAKQMKSSQHNFPKFFIYGKKNSSRFPLATSHPNIPSRLNKTFEHHSRATSTVFNVKIFIFRVRRSISPTPGLWCVLSLATSSSHLSNEINMQINYWCCLGTEIYSGMRRQIFPHCVKACSTLAGCSGPVTQSNLYFMHINLLYLNFERLLAAINGLSIPFLSFFMRANVIKCNDLNGAAIPNLSNFLCKQKSENGYFEIMTITRMWVGIKAHALFWCNLVEITFLSVCESVLQNGLVGKQTTVDKKIKRKKKRIQSSKIEFFFSKAFSRHQHQQ